MSKGLSTEKTIIPAWWMAIRNRPVLDKLICYSARGMQYACLAFDDVLNANKWVYRCMCRKGNCWDTATAYFVTM